MSPTIQEQAVPPTVGTQHVSAAVVACLLVGLGLAGGGYSLEVQAAVAIAVWWIVGAGLLLGAWPRARVPTAALLAAALLGALALLTAASVAWGDDAGRGVAEALRTSAYLGLFGLAVIATPRGGAGGVLRGLGIGLTSIALLALASRLQPSLFPEQQLPELLPSARARLAYPLDYWNGLAAAVALAVVALLWLGSEARTRFGRALAVGLLPGCLLALFFTSSRGGVAALIAGAAVLAVLARGLVGLSAGAALAAVAGGAAVAVANGMEELVDGRLATRAAERQGDELTLVVIGLSVGAAILRWLLDPLLRGELRHARRPLRATVLVALAAIVFVAAGPAERIDTFTDPPSSSVSSSRAFVSEHLTSGGGSGRWQFWESAADAVEAHPLTGLGAGGFEAWWSQQGSLDYYVRDAHSLFMETAAELGLLGLGLLIGFVAVVATAGLRRMSSDQDASQRSAALALVACGTVSAAIDWTWELPAAFAAVLVAAAVAVGPGTAADGRRLPRSAALAAYAIGLAAVVTGALLFSAEQAVDESRAAVAGGELPEALRHANAAVAVTPWAAAPRLQRALVEETLGDLGAAHRSIREATDRAPDDWRLWLATARIRLEIRDVPAARAALRRARSLNPRSPLFAELRRP